MSLARFAATAVLRDAKPYHCPSFSSQPIDAAEVANATIKAALIAVCLLATASVSACGTTASGTGMKGRTLDDVWR
jgi:hypothetical protein